MAQERILIKFWGDVSKCETIRLFIRRFSEIYGVTVIPGCGTTLGKMLKDHGYDYRFSPRRRIIPDVQGRIEARLQIGKKTQEFQDDLCDPNISVLVPLLRGKHINGDTLLKMLFRFRLLDHFIVCTLLARAKKKESAFMRYPDVKIVFFAQGIDISINVPIIHKS